MADPSPSRLVRAASTSLLAIVALTLSACATTAPGSATPTPTTASPTAPVSPAVTASPTATPADPSPSPTESATGEPFNGEILVITSEVRDGSLEVTAMVPGVSESDGTCTLTLEPSKESVSVTGAEGKDVTYCGLMSIPVADAADVAFTVSYRSSSLSAQSDTATLETTP